MFISIAIASRAACAGVLCLALALPVPAHEKVGKALLTFYWVIDETSPEYEGDRSAVLRDPAGRVLARTHRKFKLDLVRQGTGWLRDGRTVIYIKKVRGESRVRL